MSSKIDGVPRELLELAAEYLKIHGERSSIEYNTAEDLLALLGAQPQGVPVAHLMFEDTFYGVNGPEVGDFDIQYDHEACEQLAKSFPGQQVALYAAPVVERQPVKIHLNKTIEQWRLVDAKLCANQNSPAANQFLITDAQRDIASLGCRIAELQATIAQQAADVKRLKTMADNYSALLMDANAKIERLKSGQGEPVACTSCDGSGEYIDAIGDWRGYCSCPAGIALKIDASQPAPGSVVPEPASFSQLLSQAKKIVEAKTLWKKFIKGTPLSNDIAVWMAEFAMGNSSGKISINIPQSKPTPELMPMPTLGYDRFDEGWNACLDKLKELNP